MIVTSKNDIDISSRSLEDDGIINIDDLIQIIINNKKLISLLTLSGLIISIIIAYSKNNVWAGKFQILVRKDNNLIENSSLNSNNSNLISSLTGKDKNLSTEVEILKSPSVLMPVFNFVKENKEFKNIDTKNMKYSEWLKNNLKVELVKNTDILDLTYKDVDKEIILPTLNKISETYQSYSGRNRSEGISKALFYLDEQIKKYKNKSKNSLNQSLLFAQKYDLNPIKALSNSSEKMDEENIEIKRIQAANETRSLKQKIVQLEKENDSYKSIYLAREIDTGAGLEMITRFDELNNEILKLKSIYIKSVPSLRSKENERDKLAKEIKSHVYSSLKAKLKLAEAEVLASQRPEGVLIKYSELLREATLDENTLFKLINDRRKISLEKAREEDPWELISKPTIFEDPLEPNRNKFTLIGLMVSLLSSISLVTFISKLKGIIYNPLEIESLLNIKILQNLVNNKINNFEEDIKLLVEGTLLNKNSKNYALMPLGEIPEEKLKLIEAKINHNMNSQSIKISKNLTDLTENEKILIISTPGAVRKGEILKFKKDLALKEIQTIGLLILNIKYNF